MKRKDYVSQEKLVLKYLKRFKVINHFSARDLFGVHRLSGVIYNLKKQGHKIKSIRRWTQTGNGRRGASVAYYHLMLRF